MRLVLVGARLLVGLAALLVVGAVAANLRDLQAMVCVDHLLLVQVHCHADK